MARTEIVGAEPLVPVSGLRTVLMPLSRLGIGVGLVTGGLGYVPSLLPRPWLLQAVVVGLGMALGYGIGSLVDHYPRRRGSKSFGLLEAGALGAGGAALLALLVLHLRWRLDVSRLMGLEASAYLYLIASLAIAAAVALVVVAFARLVGLAYRAARAGLTHLMPSRVAGPVAALAFVLIGASLVDGLLLDRGMGALEAAARTSDQRFDETVQQSDSSSRSGGPSSLISWDDLGRQGRAFVAGGPSLVEIAAFGSEAPNDPVRAYVGLKSGSTISGRVQLAVSELDRLGGFDREIVVVVMPTGSGWVDPFAIDPLELMYEGDTAALAVQYSDLPSWLVLMRNQDPAVEVGRALVEAVENRLLDTPEQSRPTLLIYGESLGSFALERAYSDFDDLRARVDGALLVGPPWANPIWRSLTDAREAQSPIWSPVVEDGRSVRFGPDGKTLSSSAGQWELPRVAYLQHPSDPITWMSADMMFREPVWMGQERGPDVSPHMYFVPLVTFWQVAFDLLMATGAPAGHGHRFAGEQAHAWALVIPPNRWSNSDTARLVALFE